MEENDSFVYNKKRAAGRDKNDRPKNLQLKVRKLNPINTICYVQVYFYCNVSVIWFVVWLRWVCGESRKFWWLFRISW